MRGTDAFYWLLKNDRSSYFSYVHQKKKLFQVFMYWTTDKIMLIHEVDICTHLDHCIILKIIADIYTHRTSTFYVQTERDSRIYACIYSIHAYGTYLSYLLSFVRQNCTSVWLLVINQTGSRALHTNYWSWPSSIINAKWTQPHSHILREVQLGDPMALCLLSQVVSCRMQIPVQSRVYIH